MEKISVPSLTLFYSVLKFIAPKAQMETGMLKQKKRKKHFQYKTTLYY